MTTIKDVARAAKVSVATVSRVLNDSGPVSESTSRIIRDVAARMRYVPHGAARSLITHRTDTLGVLLPDLYGEFFSEAIRGMDSAAQQAGFHLLVSSSHADKGEFEKAMGAMRGRVDGLVVMSPDLDAGSLRNIPESLPLILLCSRSNGSDLDCLTIQNCIGAREMVRHLISLGHTRIAIVTGAVGNYDAAERLRGYRMALREARISPDAALERCGGFTESGGYEAAVTILEAKPRPTAIFAANDSMAIGVLSALRQADIRVPDDIAVAGFDDIPLARYMDPPLSSVHVPICDLGERAIALLLNGITHKNRHPRRNERIATELVIRGSTRSEGAVKKPSPASSRTSRKKQKNASVR